MKKFDQNFFGLSSAQIPSPAHADAQGVDYALFKAGYVRHISVSGFPEDCIYDFTGRNAQAILDYLSGLDLVEDATPPPPGGVSDITIEYEDGSTVKLYHSANEYIGISGGSQYKMTYEQASAFDSLLDELNGNK